MRLVIVASRSCGHCRKYARMAGEYVPVSLFDVSNIKALKRQITGVPYSILYDDNTVIGEWQGTNLEPLFDLMEGEKMKIRFLIDCVDKHTGKPYKKGSVRTFPEARAKEIIATGAAKEVKSDKRDSE